MLNLSKWDTSDLIAFASLIILGVSLISPMVVAYIHRKTELKSKMLDIYKENFSKRYNREYFIFQDYIEKCGIIIAKLDSSQRPSQKEIQQFESASLKCLIFLSDSERVKFDTFRITVKKSLGIEDPRGKKTPLHEDYFKELAQTITTLTGGVLPKVTGVNPVYTSFNQCINIAAQRLATIEAEEEQRLHSVQITLRDRILQTLLKVMLKLGTLCMSTASRVRKLFQSRS